MTAQPRSVGLAARSAEMPESGSRGLEAGPEEETGMMNSGTFKVLPRSFHVDQTIHKFS